MARACRHEPSGDDGEEGNASELGKGGGTMPVIRPRTLVRILATPPGIASPQLYRVLLVHGGIATLVAVDATGEPIRAIAEPYPVEMLVEERPAASAATFVYAGRIEPMPLPRN